MIRCNHCATDNLDGSEYCDECGTKLAGSLNSAGPTIGSLRQPHAPPQQFITQVAPPPPSFTRDSITPKPATPYTPPPPPPVNPPESKLVNQAGGVFPPPPAITSLPMNNPQSGTALPGPPQAPSSMPVGGRPPAPPAGNLTTAFNGQTGGLSGGGEGGRYQAQGNDGSGGALQVRARLVIQRGGKIGKEFPLVGAESMIGRWDADGGIFPDVDLDQDDPEAKVSRRHARIQQLNNQFLIEDLGSTNGTFINRGPRLLPGAKQPLNHGDEIIVGKTFLKFILN